VTSKKGARRKAAGGGPAGHRLDAHRAHRKAGAAVITVSSTRTQKTDESGAILCAAFEEAGHRVLYRAIVKDDVSHVQAAVRDALSMAGVDVVVTSGGTGMAKGDLTIEAVLPLLDKRADGWGDVFRSVSREEIGNAAMLTRSVAGTAGGKWVFAIPGSAGAARTAIAKLILPELEHMLWEARR